MNKKHLKDAAFRFEKVYKRTIKTKAIFATYNSLLPLLDDAKKGMILEPMKAKEIPGNYHFIEGDLSVASEFQNAYIEFRVNLRGGLTKEEKDLIDIIENL